MRAEREPARLRAIRGEVVQMPGPRLAWSPWARGLLLGLALGLVVGFLAGALLALSIMEARVAGMERRLSPPERVYEHGEPVRR